MSLQSRRKDQVSSDAEPVSSSQISRTEATSLLHDNEISSSSLIPVIVVVGSTSVGKTKLSVDLAKALNGEIINADSIQVYDDLPIGSAKADCAEQEGVPHHILSCIPAEYGIHVKRFVSLAQTAIESIHARGKVPILCGGTFHWVEALLFRTLIAGDAADSDDLNSLQNQENHEDREDQEDQKGQEEQENNKQGERYEQDEQGKHGNQIPTQPSTQILTIYSLENGLLRSPADYRAFLTTRPQDELFAELSRVDPESTTSIPASDNRKTRRALEFLHETGLRRSIEIQRTGGLAGVGLRYRPCFLWVFARKRSIYRRMKSRIGTMQRMGLSEEVRALYLRLMKSAWASHQSTDSTDRDKVKQNDLIKKLDLSEKMKFDSKSLENTKINDKIPHLLYDGISAPDFVHSLSCSDQKNKISQFQRFHGEFTNSCQTDLSFSTIFQPHDTSFVPEDPFRRWSWDENTELALARRAQNAIEDSLGTLKSELLSFLLSRHMVRFPRYDIIWQHWLTTTVGITQAIGFKEFLPWAQLTFFATMGAASEVKKVTNQVETEIQTQTPFTESVCSSPLFRLEDIPRDEFHAYCNAYLASISTFKRSSPLTDSINDLNSHTDVSLVSLLQAMEYKFHQTSVENQHQKERPNHEQKKAKVSREDGGVVSSPRSIINKTSDWHIIETPRANVLLYLSSLFETPYSVLSKEKISQRACLEILWGCYSVLLTNTRKYADRQVKWIRNRLIRLYLHYSSLQQTTADTPLIGFYRFDSTFVLSSAEKALVGDDIRAFISSNPEYFGSFEEQQGGSVQKNLFADPVCEPTGDWLDDVSRPAIACARQFLGISASSEGVNPADFELRLHSVSVGTTNNTKEQAGIHNNSIAELANYGHQFVCKICDKKVSGDSNWRLHLSSKGHKANNKRHFNPQVHEAFRKKTKESRGEKQ